MTGPMERPTTDAPVRCTVCGERLRQGEIICSRCEAGREPEQRVDVVEFGEIRSLIRRARYLIVIGVILFPWVLQPWAFVCSAKALAKLNRALMPDDRLRRQATIALLASGLLTVLYWASILHSFRRTLS